MRFPARTTRILADDAVLTPILAGLERGLLSSSGMIALNEYITESLPMTSHQPSLHVIGGDPTAREYVINQLANVGFSARESSSAADLLVHESDHELVRRREFWDSVDRKVAKLTVKDREVLDLLMECFPNKVLAIKLGITERAVEMRRASFVLMTVQWLRLRGTVPDDVMKTLTALTAIFLPLNLITGFFGMNFENFPFGVPNQPEFVFYERSFAQQQRSVLYRKSSCRIGGK